jgi:hypothetical protein
MTAKITSKGRLTSPAVAEKLTTYTGKSIGLPRIDAGGLIEVRTSGLSWAVVTTFLDTSDFSQNKLRSILGLPSELWPAVASLARYIITNRKACSGSARFMTAALTYLAGTGKPFTNG